MKYVLIAMLTLSASYLAAQKQVNYTVATDDLSKKILAATGSTSPIRLAVVPFTATKSSVQSSPQFGEYLTETIIGGVSGRSEKIKLFERTRLDAVLKEQEFILTDMMKPAAALKIGQLVPIDALLSGTYTKLKSYIDVNARLLDVASGEILVSYTARIKMNKNLATLFPENTTTMSSGSAPTTTSTPVNVTINNSVTSTMSLGKSKADVCKAKVADFRPRLNDLSSNEKIVSVVIEAKKTPFDNLCGQLHYDVMYSFTRFKIDNPAYKDFLLATLDTIRYPAGDDRAYEIIRFLAADNQVDEKEWAAAFNAVARVGNYSLSTYLNYLIAKSADVEERVSQSRIASYFALASNAKLGLPRPVSFETAYFEMMEGVKSNQSLRQHVYKTYSPRLTLDDKSRSTMFSELQSMYKDETNLTKKAEIMNWIITFVNGTTYDKAHEQLYDFVRDFELTSNEQRNKQIRSDYLESDLRILAAQCREKFSAYAMLTPYQSQREDRIEFCVAYSIPIPGVIPTLDEAATILKGNDLDEQLRVMKLLELMGDKPKRIENAVVGVFEKRSLEDREKLKEIQTHAIAVLGNVKSANTKGIDYMISTLPNYGNDTDAAKEALVKIGKPAVPALISRLDKTTDQDGGNQYQLITILGKIGKDAAPAVKSIQRVATQQPNGDVKYAAEAALQIIQ